MKWLNDEAIVNFDIHMAHNLSNYRYILKVDLEYPEKLHLHISYPLPPEKKCLLLMVRPMILQNHTKWTWNNRGKTEKLIPNL